MISQFPSGMNPSYLDVYFVMNVGDNIDTKTLEKCIHVFLATKYGDFIINVFEKVDLQEARPTGDVIKQGLFSFTQMFNQLKLKNSNETWFIYIANGHIDKVQNKVGVILLNRKPYINECTYAINKQPFDINIDASKERKLGALKEFTNTLQGVFKSKKIRYKG